MSAFFSHLIFIVNAIFGYNFRRPYAHFHRAPRLRFESRRRIEISLNARKLSKSGNERRNVAIAVGRSFQILQSGDCLFCHVKTLLKLKGINNTMEQHLWYRVKLKRPLGTIQTDRKAE
ncbi:hypothetical protein IW261DRAFT_1447346 [Armillaria novae-zelandiae]|uniref:Uncharacterized protein n=1 Tax=Armillaria novae-zelandiae TaxID=153914 RepID=A0AA39PN85_9AGAR|nr:hypothetical protein IW261DRAFT_1447346 [Armillaria novae-zelandiae]